MSRPCFSVFLPPQVIMGKAVCSRKTIPHWPRRWPILIMSYVVIHQHWINPGRFSEKYICHSIFECLSIYFLLVLPYGMVHVCFSALLQVFLLALTSFGSLADWLTWMIPFHFKNHEAESDSLNSFHIWSIKSVWSKGGGYQQCKFLVKIINR